MIYVFYIQNRLGITEAQENTRKSDCVNSRLCFYVPVVNSTAVSRDEQNSLKELSQDSLGLVHSPLGL